MARKTTGTGDRALASYVRQMRPEILAEAEAYWETWLERRAQQARDKRRAVEASRLEGQIAALQAKLAKYNGNGHAETFDRIEDFGATVLQ